MNGELKNCPFCGSADVGLTKQWNESILYAECQNCFARTGNWKAKGGASLGARQDWNHRALSPEVKALVEAAEDVSQCSTMSPNEMEHLGMDDLMAALDKLRAALEPFDVLAAIEEVKP